jgi:hypothetical protein
VALSRVWGGNDFAWGQRSNLPAARQRFHASTRLEWGRLDKKASFLRQHLLGNSKITKTFGDSQDYKCEELHWDAVGSRLEEVDKPIIGERAQRTSSWVIKVCEIRPPWQIDNWNFPSGARGAIKETQNIKISLINIFNRGGGRSLLKIMIVLNIFYHLLLLQHFLQLCRIYWIFIFLE